MDTVGTVSEHISHVVRPDGRCFVRFTDRPTEADARLLDELGRELYAVVAADVDEERRALERLGFVVHRVESNYAIPIESAVQALQGAALPPELDLIEADRADEHRVRTLDETLRDDVPGTSGWRWVAEEFRRQDLDSAAFDPRTYLVAVERTTDDYVGLVRVWNNPEGPRLGLVAVVRAHRRRGLARALLAAVFAVLHARGERTVVAEVDDANVASRALLASVGARRTGGTIELIRR